jgi:hypothetical protein
MKFIIYLNGKKLLNATSDWNERMGDKTPEQFAEEINGVVVTVPDTYNIRNVSIDHFVKNNNGEYSFSSQKYYETLNGDKLNKLRRKRKWYCFNIINRGQVWYNTLTEQEQEELQEWYQEWLDITSDPDLNLDNPILPTPPAWLQPDIKPYPFEND